MTDRYFDNTRVSEFRTCQRKFFYRHVMDWASVGFAPPLLFGSSWHAAMDAIWETMGDKKNAQSLGTEEVAHVGYDAFMKEWVEGGGPEVDDINEDWEYKLGFRNPMVALEMLYGYVDERRPLFQRDSFELISIEQPFAVPLDPEDDTLFYVGRFDKVFRVKEGIIIGEHKTTSLYAKVGGFRPMFIDSFSPNSQVDGYLHAARVLYGTEVKSCWIDAALVHKTEHDFFKIIPIERQFAQLDAWLWETRSWIDGIEANWARVLEKSPEGDFDMREAKYMAAFPKNTNACQDFARNCPYIDLCKMIPNPLGRDTPAGFANEHWSPFDRLDLGKIGLEKPHDNA
jgi:hypothetical protein